MQLLAELPSPLLPHNLYMDQQWFETSLATIYSTCQDHDLPALLQYDMDLVAHYFVRCTMVLHSF